MESNVDSESKSLKSPAHSEAYIGEVPLRSLARLIARDILANKPFLAHKHEVVKPNLKPKKTSQRFEGNKKSEKK